MGKEDIFKNKVTSSFPLAIGTGLCLESMFDAIIEPYDKEREIPNKVVLKDYKYHIWNIYTIIRNLIYSVEEKDKIEVLSSKYLQNAITEEVDNLVSLYQNCDIEPIIFIPKYDAVYEHYNKGKEGESTKHMLENNAITSVLKHINIKNNINTLKGVYKIPELEGKVLITTHMVCDLLNQHIKLVLLESNTGKLKTKYDWYTKYHPIGKRALDMLPMVEDLLYLLGDNKMIFPSKLSNRLALFELALNKSWTVRSSRDKIVSDIRQNPLLHDSLDNFKRIYH